MQFSVGRSLFEVVHRPSPFSFLSPLVFAWSLLYTYTVRPYEETYVGWMREAYMIFFISKPTVEHSAGSRYRHTYSPIVYWSRGNCASLWEMNNQYVARSTGSHADLIYRLAVSVFFEKPCGRCREKHRTFNMVSWGWRWVWFWKKSSEPICGGVCPRPYYGIWK